MSEMATLDFLTDKEYYVHLSKCIQTSVNAKFNRKMTEHEVWVVRQKNENLMRQKHELDSSNGGDPSRTDNLRWLCWKICQQTWKELFQEANDSYPFEEPTMGRPPIYDYSRDRPKPLSEEQCKALDQTVPYERIGSPLWKELDASHMPRYSVAIPFDQWKSFRSKRGLRTLADAFHLHFTNCFLNYFADTMRRETIIWTEPRDINVQTGIEDELTKSCLFLKSYASELWKLHRKERICLGLGFSEFLEAWIEQQAEAAKLNRSQTPKIVTQITIPDGREGGKDTENSRGISVDILANTRKRPAATISPETQLPQSKRLRNREMASPEIHSSEAMDQDKRDSQSHPSDEETSSTHTGGMWLRLLD